MLREWAEKLLEFASSDWGPVVMVSHAYLESCILPLAHELFLIPVALAKPHLSFVYALMSTVASVLGIATGYGIGHWGGRKIILKFVSEEKFKAASKKIHEYDAWAVAIACFTPVPVRVFAVVAGAVGIHFKKMLVIAFLSRGLRFMLVSGLLYWKGAVMRDWILDYMNIIMLTLFVMAVVFSISWRFIEKALIKRDLESA